MSQPLPADSFWERGYRLIRRFAAISLTVLLCAWLARQMAEALAAAVHFSDIPEDGPFQLFNPLRRIAAGQRIGVDFQYFHGAAIPYLHYPFYRLLGGNLFASEFSRQLLSPVASLAATLLFFFTVFRSRLAALACATVALVASSHLAWSLYQPANSLLAVRTLVPLIYCSLMMRDRGPRRDGIYAGIMLAAALLLGIEHGISLAVAHLVFAIVRHGRGIKTLLLEYFYTALSGLLTLGSILLPLAGMRGAISVMKYNLMIAPGEQFWYFGTIPNPFISEPGELLHPDFLPGFIQGVSLLAVAIGFLFWRPLRQLRGNRPNVAFATLAFYGLLTTAASLGYLARHLQQPVLRITIFLSIVLLLQIGRRILLRLPFAAAACLKYGALMLLTVAALVGAARFVNSPPGNPVARIGGLLHDLSAQRGEASLSPDWRRHLAQVAAAVRAGPQAGMSHHPILWSLYAGLPEAQQAVFQPDTDYIIHALGNENRERYLQRFDESRPDVVLTVLRKTFKYEEWLQNSHWDFYESLLRHYQPADATPFMLIWTGYQEQPRFLESPPVPLNADPDGLLSLPKPPASMHPQIAVVRLQYRIHNPWHLLPVFGLLPRQLIHITNSLGRTPMSLSPHLDEMSFPVFLDPGKEPALRPRTESLLPSVHLELLHTSVRFLQLRDDSLRFLPEQPLAAGNLLKPR